MNKKRNFPLALIAAVVMSSGLSHLLAAWLGIGTKEEAQLFTVGDSTNSSIAYLAGSSLASYGVEWDKISESGNLEIRTWGIGGSSPFEWEQYQAQLPEASSTFIVISAYDLDEAMICDFRAELVPLGHTINALVEVRPDRDYSKRVLSQYPATWLRTLFPTLGRSRATMGKLRLRAKELLKRGPGDDLEEAGLRIDFGQGDSEDGYQRKRISDWTEGEMANKIVAMRTSFSGAHSFDGLKMHAFRRMLEYGTQRGRVVVLVLPVSESYTASTLSSGDLAQFGQGLSNLRSEIPAVKWLRLDLDVQMAADAHFCDLVHMNYQGQALATEALLEWLGSPGAKQ